MSSAFKRRSGIGDIYPPNQDESSDVGGALNAAQNNPGGELGQEYAHLQTPPGMNYSCLPPLFKRKVFVYSTPD